MTTHTHFLAVKKAAKELNQALLDAAFAGINIHIETGNQPYGMGPLKTTTGKWIKVSTDE